MGMTRRKHPAHPPPIVDRDRPTIVFLTVCVRNRRPLLVHPEVQLWLKAAWKSADRWTVGRYVLMPDHIHLFCAPADPETRLRTWIAYWQWIVSRRWPRPDEKPLWQKDHWDTQLRQGASYSAKWEYVRRNPVRARLVAEPDQWPYQGEINVLPWLER